jgi:hypothetical protein
MSAASHLGARDNARAFGGEQRSAMIAPRLTLSRRALQQIVAVLDAPTHGFVALVRTAGLDPARDFRGSVLDGVDFGTDDQSGFDFSGADLSGADLTRASGLDKMVTDHGTFLPSLPPRPPEDFDLGEVRRLIIGGQAPPRSSFSLQISN